MRRESDLSILSPSMLKKFATMKAKFYSPTATLSSLYSFVPPVVHHYYLNFRQHHLAFGTLDILKNSAHPDFYLRIFSCFMQERGLQLHN